MAFLRPFGGGKDRKEELEYDLNIWKLIMILFEYV
jgi:hypothetical protein